MFVILLILNLAHSEPLSVLQIKKQKEAFEYLP